MIGLQIASQYDLAVARLRNAPRQACRRGTIWRKPGRTEQWWLNLLNGILPESDLKKNFLFLKIYTFEVTI